MSIFIKNQKLTNYMSIKNKQLDQQSIDRASHMAFVYAKDGKIRVLHIEQTNRERDGLVADGWKHTATLDAAMFIENLWNVEAQNNAAISELRKLTLTYKEQCAEKEASEAIKLLPANGKPVLFHHPTVGPHEIEMTVQGMNRDQVYFESLKGQVLNYKILGNIQLPFKGELTTCFTAGPTHEEMMYAVERKGYEARMDYTLVFTIHE